MPTLYLVPAPLDFGCEVQAPLQDALPLGTLQAAARLTHWVCENAKTARAYLKRIDAVVPLAAPLQAQSFQELPREVHKKGDHDGVPAPAAIVALAPLREGHDVGLFTVVGAREGLEGDLRSGAHEVGEGALRGRLDRELGGIEGDAGTRGGGVEGRAGTADDDLLQLDRLGLNGEGDIDVSAQRGELIGGHRFAAFGLGAQGERAADREADEVETTRRGGDRRVVSIGRVVGRGDGHAGQGFAVSGAKRTGDTGGRDLRERRGQKGDGHNRRQRESYLSKERFVHGVNAVGVSISGWSPEVGLAERTPVIRSSQACNPGLPLREKRSFLPVTLMTGNRPGSTSAAKPAADFRPWRKRPPGWLKYSFLPE